MANKKKNKRSLETNLLLAFLIVTFSVILAGIFNSYVKTGGISMEFIYWWDVMDKVFGAALALFIAWLLLRAK